MTGKKTRTAAKKAPQPSALAKFGAQLLQPTTIAGLLTIGSSVATGGVAAWLNPQTLPFLLTGVGLIFAKDDNSVVQLLSPFRPTVTPTEGE